MASGLIGDVFGKIFSYFGVAGSTVRDVPGVTQPDMSNIRRLRCDDDGNLTVVAAAGALTDVNLVQVDGDAVLNGGIAGAQSIGGTQASGAVNNASWPVKIGAVVKDVLSLYTVGALENLLSDVYGRLHVRNAGFDETDDAQRASVLNQPETDRDESPQIWVNTTNVAAAANYPSDAGIEVADRSFLSWQVRMRDGVFDIQVCDDGTNWVTTTKSPVDNAEGTNGFDNTHYAEADVAVVDFALDWERCGHRYIRLRFTPNNATNTIIVYCMQRAL